MSIGEELRPETSMPNQVVLKADGTAPNLLSAESGVRQAFGLLHCIARNAWSVADFSEDSSDLETVSELQLRMRARPRLVFTN